MNTSRYSIYRRSNRNLNHIDQEDGLIHNDYVLKLIFKNIVNNT